jgi:sugar O-acyltransferase (sialic acid O-acetyltransferase NeuD family)
MPADIEANDIWYVFGAGGFGVETMDILETAIRRGTEAPHRIAFLVDHPKSETLLGLPVTAVGDHVRGAKVTIALGEPSDRAVVRARVVELGLKLASIISADAFVSTHAQIAEGVIIAPHVSIQATARIETNVAINTGAIAGHDVVVEADAVLSSMANIGGGTTVGNAAYVGMGALVKERLCIGREAIVGMGSVVHTDIPDEMIALGNPARIVRRNEDKKVFR